jgi:hypothetical protein
MYALDPERTAVLPAALKDLAVDPRSALNAFRTCTEDAGDWDEWLLGPGRLSVLAYQ